MKFIIVNKTTLEIKGSYEAEAKDDTSNNRSHLLAEPICKHVELPKELSEDLCEAVLDEDGEIVLRFSEEKEKLQIDRAWQSLRIERDMRLNETDKYLLPDFPISEKKLEEIKGYRAGLRDLPENILDPRKKVDWPKKPKI